MNTPDIIDLSSDEETEALCVKDIKPHLLSVIGCETTNEKNDVPQGSCGIKQEKLYSEELLHTSSAHNDCSLPFRQFWRSGEYETGKDLGPSSLSIQSLYFTYMQLFLIFLVIIFISCFLLL